MSEPAPAASFWRTVSIVGGFATALLAAALVTQHFRHGWPFSLHHGYAATDARARNARGAGGHESHGATDDRGADETEDPDSGAADAAANDMSAAAVSERARVALDRARQDLIGIRIQTVGHAALEDPVRAVATIAPDESLVSHVHTRVSGWIERLYVRTTGQTVRAGQALAAIFSPELVASQTEFLGAVTASARLSPEMQRPLLAAARQRLRVFGMNEGEIATVESTRRVMRTVTVSAPRSGVVLHRGIAVGTAVDPSTEILTVMDLSRVWALAEVSERDIPLVRVGASVTLTFPAAAGQPVDATIDFLYPTLEERTRTLRARIVISNPTGVFRPGIYGTAEIRVSSRHGLVVPRDAVVDTGAQQHVFVVDPDGSFVPRRVVSGITVGDTVEIRSGLSDGDRVVASGVFLLDSESRLRASGGAGTGHAGHGGAPAPASSDSSTRQSPAGGHGGHGGHEGHGAAP